MLLDNGANVNATDANGQTALSRADFLGFDDVVKELKKRGANHCI